jgi:6-pyruvoyltetrahydropterin/6-carboxytetrahydropterin synthase
MIKLSREIRFALVRPEQRPSRVGSNTWSGWPSSTLLIPHLSLRCVLRGEPDPVTGYLCNIKLIDDLLQSIVMEQVIPAYWHATEGIEAVAILRLIDQSARDCWSRLKEANGQIESIELECSPFQKISILSEEPKMVLLTQQFEFSAAHRLHCPELSAEENRQVFGKCNHPSGHGHNYVVEITVEANFENGGLRHLESTVKRTIIDRLDHKHLNEDVDYFQRVNPSVENIARQIFVWLQPELSPLILKRVRVYETPKTWAECESGE